MDWDWRVCLKQENWSVPTMQRPRRKILWIPEISTQDEKVKWSAIGDLGNDHQKQVHNILYRKQRDKVYGTCHVQSRGGLKTKAHSIETHRPVYIRLNCVWEDAWYRMDRCPVLYEFQDARAWTYWRSAIRPNRWIERELTEKNAVRLEEMRQNGIESRIRMAKCPNVQSDQMAATTEMTRNDQSLVGIPGLFWSCVSQLAVHEFFSRNIVYTQKREWI